MKDKRKKVREAYDKIAEEYAEKTEDSEMKGYDEVIDHFHSKFSGELLLDAGCGSLPFNIERAETIGIGISREQLNLVETNEKLIHGDITKLPFSNDVFSGVVAFYSLIHVPLEYHSTVLEEFHRVLHSGGVLLVTEGKEKWCGSEENWIGADSTMSWELAGREKTRKQLETAGFNVVEETLVTSTLGDGDEKVFFLAETK